MKPRALKEIQPNTHAAVNGYGAHQLRSGSELTQPPQHERGQDDRESMLSEMAIIRSHMEGVPMKDRYVSNGSENYSGALDTIAEKAGLKDIKGTLAVSRPYDDIYVMDEGPYRKKHAYSRVVQSRIAKVGNVVDNKGQLREEDGCKGVWKLMLNGKGSKEEDYQVDLSNPTGLWFSIDEDGELAAWEVNPKRDQYGGYIGVGFGFDVEQVTDPELVNIVRSEITEAAIQLAGVPEPDAEQLKTAA
jgi:hypothetical protein